MLLRISEKSQFQNFSSSVSQTEGETAQVHSEAAMALLLTSPAKIATCECRFKVNNLSRSNRSAVIGSRRGIRRGEQRRFVGVQACFDPFGDQAPPIVRDALKEPVAFLGGVFVGILRLDLNEDPLKEWVSRTVEASGIAEEVQRGDDGSEQNGEDDTPQQILIE